MEGYHNKDNEEWDRVKGLHGLVMAGVEEAQLLLLLLLLLRRL